MISTSWMLLLLFRMLQNDDIPGFAVFFDILLIAGLTYSRVQMRNGPYPVFLTAALAVSVSMPLLSQLGFFLENAEGLRRYNENRPPGQPEFTLEVVNTIFWIACSFAGLIVSAPIWLAGLKVATAQRRRDERRK